MSRDNFTQPIEDRKMVFKALMGRLIDHLNAETELGFFHCTKYDSPHKNTDFSWAGMYEVLGVVINGVEVPVFGVAEQQKGGTGKHTEGWIQMGVCNSTICEFVESCFDLRHNHPAIVQLQGDMIERLEIVTDYKNLYLRHAFSDQTWAKRVREYAPKDKLEQAIEDSLRSIGRRK